VSSTLPVIPDSKIITIIIIHKLDIMAHTCNPSYSEDRDQEYHTLKPAPGKWFPRLYLEKTHHKKGLAEWLKQ
jgi:hypothetical protein